MLRSDYVQSEEKSSIKDSFLRIILKIAALDIAFLILFRIALILIPHQESRSIFYININFSFIIACLAWMNLKKSKVNRQILFILALWKTSEIIHSVFYLLTTHVFSEQVVWINYHMWYINFTSFQFFFTLYIFFLSIFPHKTNKFYFSWSAFLTFSVVLINYVPIFVSGDYIQEELDPLFRKSYYMHIINFCLLVVFWHQYTQSKLIFSEYLSSILSVHTVLIGLEILHSFSYQNGFIFVYFAQYFNAILYTIFTVLLVARLNYLDKPESIENENYVQNYYMLHGFIDKPRKGLLITFYTGMNKTALIIATFVMIFLGIYLFFYDRFEIFIKLNILILILAFIISIILAILTWHKRWYDAMGFLFKKKKR
jgi:hypothetical protein